MALILKFILLIFNFTTCFCYNVAMRKKFLVFGKPYVGKEEIEEVVATLKSGWWGTGPKAEKFEKEFAKYTNAKYALAVNSCTAGLHLALKTLRVGKGDEVITSPLTFCSTVNVILHSGAKPVFVDVNRDTWNIDARKIEPAITKKTKVILPVHLHGRPCEMEKIMKIARKRKLFVVEDAAHAAEAIYHDNHIGSIGDITVFSFYVTKNIATGEGGMATTNNEKWARDMRILSLHGLSHDAYKRYSVKIYKHYECEIPGFKYNMPDIQASLGIHQLARVEKNARARARIWEMYVRAFSKIKELILPAPFEKNIRHAKHLFAILIKPEILKISRDEFVDRLIKQNIGSGVHFNPVHLHKYYRKTFGFKKGDFPNAEFVGAREVSLPLSAAMTNRDTKDVISAVKNIVRKYRR